MDHTATEGKKALTLSVFGIDLRRPQRCQRHFGTLVQVLNTMSMSACGKNKVCCRDPTYTQQATDTDSIEQCYTQLK
jgi:hypothetical protein